MSKIYVNVPFQNTSSERVQAKTSYNLNPMLFTGKFKPSDHELAILRFYCDGNALPIFIFEDGAYKITMGYDSQYVTQTLVFQPQIQNETAGFERYVYNLTQMLNIINVGFTSCYNALKLLKPSMPATQAPYIIYNKSNGTMSLITPITGYNYAGAGGYPSNAVCSIYVNNSLYRFFDGMLFVKMSPLPYPNCDYLINQYATGQNLCDSVGNLSPTGTFISNTDETGLASWFDVASINLESAQLGTMPEVVGGSSAQFAGVGSSYNPSRNIVTDFTIAPNDPTYRSGILYYPTSEYRRIVITRDTPLETIDFNISWTDQKGIIRPVYLNPGNSFSVKLLFEQKEDLKKF